MNRQPRSRPTKLTPALVARIIALARRHTQDEVAMKLGVSQATVSRCVRRAK